VHRLFIAVDLPAPVKDQLSALCVGVPGAKWVGRSQLHLTLRFIGEVDTSRRDAIKTALAAIKSAPFTMTLQGTGRFPPRGAARVLWVGVRVPPPLTHLYDQVERTLVSLGLPPEDRGFSPHITVARLKTPPHPETIERYLGKHKSFQTDPIAVDSFILYSSVLAPQGPTYTPEGVYKLSQGEG
jgi:RNA 2',3'-cyclic 3'-phosphodiesterase